MEYDKKFLTEFYEKEGEHVGHRYDDITYNRYQQRMRDYWLKKALKKRSGKKFLEAGCFMGKYVIIASKRFSLATGLDIAESKVKSAKSNAKKNGAGNTFFFVSDAEEMALKKDSFDLVMCAEVLEHLPHPQKAINEIARVTRKHALISVPTRKSNPIASLYFWIRGEDEEELFDLNTDEHSHSHIQDYTYSMLMRQARKAGLEPVKVIGSCIFPISAKFLNRLPFLKPFLFALDYTVNRLPLFNQLGYHTVVLFRKKRRSKPKKRRELKEDFCCPVCRGEMKKSVKAYSCKSCKSKYKISNGTPILRRAYS